MPLTYNNYLKIDELLSLQERKSEKPEHDEMLFIIIHQVYELWFKETLHELDYLVELLQKNDLPRSLHTLKRICTILKTMVGQLDILETMTPVEFVSFRAFLESASGFQSYQFREFEFVLGAKNLQKMQHHPEGSTGRQRLEKRLRQPCLWDCFLQYLHLNQYPIPNELLKRDFTKPLESSSAVQKILIDIYRNNPTITQLCELLIDLDEGIQEWRYRHLKMVERTIGTKAGTGKSPGAEYLKTTLFKPLFPELWAIRAEL